MKDRYGCGSRNILLMSVGCILLVTLFLSVYSENIILDSEYTMHHNTDYTASFEERLPFIINSDLDFEANGWEGEGTESNPYFLNGVHITATGACVRIYNTISYFTIRNSFLKTPWTGGWAVDFGNVTNGRIENCTILADGSGVHLDDCSNCTFNASNFSVANRCILFNDAPNCTITNCLLESLDNSVGSGIDTWYADNLWVENNTIKGGYYGLHLYMTSATHIVNNTFIESGIGFTAFGLSRYNHIMTNNTVNGKPLLYLLSESNLIVDGIQYGEIIVVDCDDISIVDGIFVNCTFGVTIAYSRGCNLINVTSTGIGLGALVFHSDDISIINCRFLDCNTGLAFEYNMGNNIIKWTIAEGCDWGFLVTGSGWLYPVTIQECNASYCEEGFRFWRIDACELQDCFIGPNNNFGIVISDCEEWDIRDNYVFRCDVGIFLTDNSLLNNLYRNRIGWCNTTAIDNGSTTVWDDGISKGNYWSDYSGEGVYNITGTADSYDRYPAIWNDETPPVVSSFGNMEYEWGTNEVWIQWQAYDLLPDSFDLLRNGTIIENGEWGGENVSFNVGNLYVGVYNFTIIFTDIGNNTGVSTVIVRV
ncbi:MAG: NosD domain-containing protein, partial [Candidatus Thorarchaeota archaeon]